MIVTPAQARVQLKIVYVPAFAGMTHRDYTTVDRNIYDNISGSQRQAKPEYWHH